MKRPGHTRTMSKLERAPEVNYETSKLVYEKNGVFKPTHTNQSFQIQDARNLRFLNREKLVNEKFAIDEIAKADVIHVDGNKVWCDGGDEHLGHPKVYIKLETPGPHTCGYCGLRFENSQLGDSR